MVQALVEHFSQKGQPEAVEKAVLHMDIASLDLNQVSQLHPSAHTLPTCADCCFVLQQQYEIVSWMSLVATKLHN